MMLCDTISEYDTNPHVSGENKEKKKSELAKYLSSL